MSYEKLVKAHAQANNLTLEEARDEVGGVFESIRSALMAGQNVPVPGFGRFRVTRRKARTYKIGGKTHDVPASWRVSFTPFKQARGRE
jgi:nucleoid DNA-binding protein